MTATTFSKELAGDQPRRKHGGDWRPLNRYEVEVLGAVNELGPEAKGSDMVAESYKRAKAAALKSWRGYCLPEPLLMLFAYNPIQRGGVYVNLRRLEEESLVSHTIGSYAGHPDIPRSFYSITPLGRIALAYERQRVIDESKGRGTFFRVAEA